MPEIPVLVAVLVIPAVIGLTTMIKDLGLPSRFSGLVAIVLGVVAMVAFTLWGELDLFRNILIGVLVGLSAAGFYDLSKMVGGARAPATIQTPQVVVNRAVSPITPTPPTSI